MRIEHHAILFLRQANGGEAVGMRAAPGNKGKLRQISPARRLRQVKGFAAFDLGPQFAHYRRIAANQIEHETFEVRGLGNIHRRAGGDAGFGRGARTIDAGAEELVEHVVLVGGQHQLLDRQAHLAGDVAGADVAEVARRHGKGHLLVVRAICPAGSQEIALEVIDDLRRNPRPVDRIDGADLVLLLEGGVIGDCLHDVLRVVEHAGDSDVEDVGIGQRIHLGALEGAHLAVRREHEDLDVMLAPHRVLGGGAGIAGGGAEDVDRLAALVQHVLEQVAEQLHRHVLEGERRAVGQFLRVQAIFELRQRRDLCRVTTVTGKAVHLGSVGFADNGAQIGGRDIVDEARQDFVRQVGIGKLAPGVQIGTAHLRIALRQIQAAIRGQTTKKNVAKSLGRSLAASGDVAHDENPESEKRRFYRVPRANSALCACDTQRP